MSLAGPIALTLAGSEGDAYGKGGGPPARHAAKRAQLASAWRRSFRMTEWP